MAEYIARGEILDESGEAWLQEIQLGESENEDQAATLVAGLIERGILDDWTWIGLYRLDFVRLSKKTKETKG